MSSLSPLNARNFEFGGFSIGYIHVTSELTDSQVSSFNLVGLCLCHYVHFATSERQGTESGNSQSIIFILPLNWRMPTSLPFYGTQTVMSSLILLNRWVHNLVLFSLVRAESSYCQVNMITSVQRIVSLVNPNQLCPYYLWTNCA